MVRGVEPMSARFMWMVVGVAPPACTVTSNCTFPWNAGTRAEPSPEVFKAGVS